ncbi:putative acid trehalase [Rhizodiscina lignyota]|uniref:alpha,alpha-trehalase n=1 Tax=Rhizodiscina lignyota TaxID=1504668 RepID=A0A9P4IDC0_9PEZI|nr:putative acid trehalase [Rhizodiscina lignyota]
MLSPNVLLRISVIPLWLSLVYAETYNTRFKDVTWDNENWRITNTVLDQGHYQSRLSLANGYFGINVAAVGPFFEVESPVYGDDISGWPVFNRRQTFATISGFWDSQPTANGASNGTNFEWLNQYGGESIIAGVPHWGGLIVVSSGGSVLNATVPAEQISGYSSVLDIGAGVHSWRYTWTPDGEPALDIEYSMFVHKLYVNQAAVQLTITPSRDANVTVVDVLNGDCAVRTTFVDKQFEKDSATIWSAVKPRGIDNVEAYIYSTLAGDCEMSDRKQVVDEPYIGANESSIAQSVRIDLTAGQPSTIEKYIGAASSDAFKNPQQVARNASAAAAKMGISALLESHIREWDSTMSEDSVDDYSFPENGSLPNDANIVELQILSVTNPFHLLQNTVGQNAIAAAGGNEKLNINSISVCGLGSDCYAGMIFWDADVWMAPGLVVSHPEAAQQITNYRVAKHAQAKQNVKEAFTSSQNETGKFTGGAVFPWTSARFGNCTGTGPCFDYEYHINGDIGLQLYNYWVASGDQDLWKNSLFPVYDDIAYFFAELLTYDKKTGKYSLTNATDPDEYANHIDNPGFTMPLIYTHIENANNFRVRLGLPANKTWAEIAKNINIPVSESADIILEYSGMNGSIQVKQADVPLVDDFLDYPNNFTLSDLDYYASKQSPNGPGMTYGVYSVVANAASPSGCSAYTYEIYGNEPYVRGPWFQYSEQLIDDFTTNGGTHPAFPFLTGMGGANRVAVIGYLGFKFMPDSFNINPQLPPQIENLKFRTLYWQGHAINATSNQTHTVLTRLPKSLKNANPAYNDKPINVTFGDGSKPISLPPNKSITIENRRQSYNLTVPGNLAQCKPAYCPQSYVPGQLPIAAIDGAISTPWQPSDPNKTASVTVDLTSQPFQPVTGFYFDWAQNPPKSYSISFSNASSMEAANAAASEKGAATVSSSAHIKVSSPYNASNADALVPYSSNYTSVTLDKPVWSGKYATLSVLGTQGSETDVGGTVAEWAIIGSGGKDSAKRDVYRPRRWAHGVEDIHV